MAALGSALSCSSPTPPPAAGPRPESSQVDLGKGDHRLRLASTGPPSPRGFHFLPADAEQPLVWGGRKV